ncbi:Gfo/Idh/MocA family protein [Bythopirellula polymerisocia]|uniref:Inositol 2-dehydrogenase n=1 Tax=Bythopirellula polymerisocia TaxID=2528003 RepID=A0A5C6C2W5_9BACT|nr:Gfo/Idh/MocA family oxidoreductase [Bythopirellula polymerisocia]TWU17594.1 Inositol 2-dehydrogenase [Bythopirellula polymerisocia]
MSVTSAAGMAILSPKAWSAETKDIRVAVIGVRGRGREHLQALGQNVVAICDVDEQILHQRSDESAQELGRKPAKFVDYRKLLDEGDIDAVSIATPNHTHALIAIAAIQAGKDVYVEKPVSHNVWEGQQLVAAADHYGRIVQCGTQARSSSGIAEAVEWVQQGGLGRIRYAVGTCYKPRMSIGTLNRPLKIPNHIQYDLWCGPAKKQEIFRPELHYDWHWDFNTGNGDVGNQGIHQMDIARWFLGEKELPPRVLSIGGRFGYDDAGNTPNTQVVYFDYPKAPLVFETRGLPRSKRAQADWKNSMDSYRGSQIGVVVQCEQGHVLVPNYTSAIAFDLKGHEIKRWDKASDHFANWLNAIANQDKSLLNGKIQEGYLSSSLCQLAGISHLVGKSATPDAAAEQIVANDLLANSFDRMVGHLRANDVVLGEDDAHLQMGEWLELDPQGTEIMGNSQATALLRRQARAPYEIPNIS